jgi:hypothetical protein
VGPDSSPRSCGLFALAVACGFLKVPRNRPQSPGFYVLGRTSESRGWEQPMKEYGGDGMSDSPAAGYYDVAFTPAKVSLDPIGPTRRRTRERRIARQPSNVEIQRRRAMERAEADLPWLQTGEAVPSRPGSPPEGGQPLETVTQDIEKAREKLTKATADYLATAIGDPAFKAATEGWETQSFLVTEVADGIEGISGELQGLVEMPLKGLSVAFGLSPGEATIAAGISTNIILAPITGPLDEASTFVEVAGLIIGLVTGMHGLVLACGKLLAHSQAKRALAHGVDELLGGSHATDTRKPVARSMPRPTRMAPDQIRPTQSQNRLHSQTGQPERRSADEIFGMRKPEDSPKSQRSAGEQYWLCLCFVPRPSAGSGKPDHSMTRNPPARLSPGRPPAAPLADDGFLHALSLRLQPSRVSSVSSEPIRKMGHLPEGQHFILRMGSIGVGTVNAKSSPQATYQHPSCLTGQCVPLESTPCVCRCTVCQRARAIARLGNRLRGSINVQLPGRPVIGLSTRCAAAFRDYDSSAYRCGDEAVTS